MHTLLRVAIAAVLLYAALCVLVYLAQRSLLYFPAHASAEAALAHAQRVKLQAWRDEAGGLLGWRPPATAPVRILVFHGNAGSALWRDYYNVALGGAAREVILFEYPGYGARPGVVTQASLVEAGTAAVARLRREVPGPVWLLGESLGSAVASQVVARDPAAVAGLILVTPLARVEDVAATHYPFLPVRWLLQDRWDSVAALAAWHGPTAVLIASEDEVVGAEQGRTLARSLTPAPRVWEQAGATHNRVDFRSGATPWPEIRALVDRSTSAQ